MTGERKSDRRVAYTKLVLREALIKLMKDQHISGITVTSICELADINRSTFYLHYTDQFDLLHQIEEEVIEKLGERLAMAQDRTEGIISGTPVSQDIMIAILEYARENIDLAHVLLSENCDFAFQQDILELAKEVVPFPDAPLSERTKDIIITHGINGCIDVAKRWLKEGAVDEPEEIADLMLQLIYSGTTSFIQK